MRSPSLCHPERPLAGRGLCKVCYYREKRASNPEATLTADRQYYRSNRDKRVAECREWRAKNPRYRREYHIENMKRSKAQIKTYYQAIGIWSRRQKSYGITRDAWMAMYDAQNGRCRICDTAVTINRASTDHDHATGRVRGILCGLCNAMLGQAKDDPKRLLSAADYLYENAS